MVATVLVVLAVFVWGDLESARHHGIAPVTPPHRTKHVTESVPKPFRVVKVYDAHSLGMSHPLDLAVAPDGDLYVTDSRQTVTEVTPRGRVVRRWGRSGTGPGEFRMYSGAIAVADDGRVYVADTGNFRVQVFSADGRFLRQVGSFGRGAGQFTWPSGVVAGTAGSMYVADDRAATVTKLTAGGREAWRIGDSATKDPDLIGHEHLGDVDSQGRLVMANDDAGRIVYLTPSGRKVDAFGTGASGSHENGPAPPGGDFPDGACGATTDTRGSVYVDSCEEASSAHHDLEVFNARHRLVAAWTRGALIASPHFAPDGQAFSLNSEGALLVLSPRGT
jgi:streptogramin lyase